MDFHISSGDMLNILFIAAGVGVAGLTILQLRAVVQIRKLIRRLFRVFLSLVIIYVDAHLARTLMEGFPGQAYRTALQAVTFAEFVASGLMVYMLSMLVLHETEPDRHTASLRTFFLAMLAANTAVVVITQFTGLCYSFDEQNMYQRAPAYLLSNLAHVAMMAVDLALVFRYRKKLRRNVRRAFAVYLTAPLAAIVLQAFFKDIQFIILATVSAAVFMFFAVMKDQIEQYENEQEERARIETELNMASNIQAHMLPSIFPAFPNRDEFDVYASMTPAKEVGGDFYDFFLVDENHLGVVIADVSGKGVPAALFMMISKILVQNYAIDTCSPGKALEIVNRQICANNPEDMFVTVWLGILDLTTGRLTAANAGHEYPALKQPDGHFELVKDKHGFVVGGMGGTVYREYEIEMKPGAKLFVYTDGVAEATDAAQQQLGTDRMLEALRAAENDSPQAVLESVNRAIAGFVKEAPQFDDLTMLCVHYIGK